jgi:peptidoglycan/LPS O-acetylase OafA/YrhL
MEPIKGFRPDIEGLRAISIVAVLLYHAELPGFSSGYVGVDAFFVISGFLITGVLVRELERRNSIDLLRFWARRAARLLPNAVLTLIVTMAGIMTISTVLSRQSSAGDVAAALLYFVNFRFSTRAMDYFDQGVQSSPAMHFWSLSVEEQFYFFWPIALLLGVWCFGRFKKGMALAFLSLLVAGSFFVMLHWVKIAPSRAFFDTESRVWQLAIGAILAIRQPAGGSIRAFSAAIGWAGLLGLLLSIGLLDELPLNPRLASVIPVLATAAALYGGSRSQAYAANPVLDNPVMQWVGRRSYSLYLWHWPLFVFVAPAIGRGISIALVVLVSDLAFTWVEQPLRIAIPNWFSSWKLLGSTFLLCCLGAGFAVLLPRFDPAYLSARGTILKRLIEAKNDGPRFIRAGCNAIEAAENGGCAFGKPGAAKKIALFGDSHAEQLFDGLDAAAAAANWELRIWVRGGCTPIDFPNGDVECAKQHNEVFAALAAYKPDAIIVTSANGGAVHLHDPQSGKRIEISRSLEIWKAGFRETLMKLFGISPRIVVVRDTPINAKQFGTECLETNLPTECATPRYQAAPADAPDAAVARSLPGIELLDLTDRFCDSKKCPAINDGIIVYRADNNHITATMSLRLQPDFVKLLGVEH